MRTQPTPSAASSIASNSYPSRSTPFSDRGYYQERVIRRARATAPVVLPVIKRENGFSINSTHASYWTEYAMYKGKDRELQFPHAVCVSYHNGDRGENGRSRPWICGVRSDRSRAQTGRNPLSQTLSHRNQLPNLPRSESNHHYTRPADSVCTRRCGLSVAESLAGRALDGRRPPTTGRARPSNRIHVRTGVWLDQRPSEHRAWMAVHVGD